MEEVQEREIAWVIADTETAGLGDKKIVCELALREICPDTLETIGEIQSLIDCECDIDPGAQAIHGISAEMLIGQPTMAEFISTPGYLDGAFDGRDIVFICHNAPFDVPLLHGLGNVKSSICTLFHARQRIPKSECGDHKLATLRAYFGFKDRGAHRAMVDVDATHQLLVELIGRAGGRTLRDFYGTQDVNVHRMPWGANAGKLLLELPPSYMQWLWGLPDLETNLRNSLEKAMKSMGVSKKGPK